MQKLFFATLLALSLTLTALPAGIARAAADLVSSTPAADATVDQSITQVQAVFSEAITSESTLTVVNAQGVAIDNADSRLDPSDNTNKTLIVSLKEVPPGRYTVNWFTVSANDLSLAEGVFSFSVGAGRVAPVTTETTAPAATTAPTATRPAATATRPAATATRPAATATRPAATATRPAATAAATGTAAQGGAGTTAPAQGASGGRTTTPTPTSRPAGVGMPASDQLPHTAGIVPTPWMFGLFAAGAAFAVWFARRRV